MFVEVRFLVDSSGRTATSFGGVASEALWNCARGDFGMASWDTTAGVFMTTVEGAVNVVWSIELLQMMHAEVTETLVVKEKFLLSSGEVLVGFSKDFHVEGFDGRPLAASAYTSGLVLTGGR